MPDSFAVLLFAGERVYMGLDMYLMNRIKDAEYDDVGTWRKANAIHAWFVDNVQDGIDNCGEYVVSKGALSVLLDLVNEVLEDHRKAEELLPTRSGFFFGSCEYDEYYFEDLKSTKEILESALKYPDETRFYYQSSW